MLVRLPSVAPARSVGFSAALSVSARGLLASVVQLLAAVPRLRLPAVVRLLLAVAPRSPLLPVPCVVPVPLARSAL